MKLIKINKKDTNSADSIVERKSLLGANYDKELLMQSQAVWDSFRPMRHRRARVIRFVYEDQWGDLITVNGKTMTQREYLISQGNVALQANLMASKANSIVGSHIKEGSVPSVHSIRREDQALGEILSETLRANWDVNDVSELENTAEFELLFGGLAIGKETYERINGVEDARTHFINPNMFAFASSMQDPRLTDISMTVELHDYTFNDLCASFAESKEDYNQLRKWYYDEASPFKCDDVVDINDKLDNARVSFLTPTNLKCCRIIEVWTKERRPRYKVFDPQTAELYEINADDNALIKQIEATNKSRTEEGHRLGYTDEEIPLIELHYFIDTFWFYRFITPTGFILREGESPLPGREHPYTIVATPLVNGKICGFLADAVDLQLAINRELVVYDWMKRLDTKGVTFVPQDIIPDGMDYKTFAEQWTSMDGIVFYKPNNSGNKPFVEHGSSGHLNTAEMVKMLSDAMSESVSVSGAIMGKTPYAGTSAQLYAQQTANSTTPIAVIMSKLESFIKHLALKKTQFIQEFYNVTQYEEVASGIKNIDLDAIDYGRIADLRYRFKYVVGPDYTSMRQQTNDLLMGLVNQGSMAIADALDLGEFPNADAIVARLNQRAAEMQAAQAAAQAQEQQFPAGNIDKRSLFMRN